MNIYMGVIGVVIETHHLKREDPYGVQTLYPPMTHLSLYRWGHQFAAWNVLGHVTPEQTEQGSRAWNSTALRACIMQRIPAPRVLHTQERLLELQEKWLPFQQTKFPKPTE